MGRGTNKEEDSSSTGSGGGEDSDNDDHNSVDGNDIIMGIKARKRMNAVGDDSIGACRFFGFLFLQWGLGAISAEFCAAAPILSLYEIHYVPPIRIIHNVKPPPPPNLV